MSGQNHDGVTLEIHDSGVAILRFQRPQKRNALRYADLDRFEELLGQAAADPLVTALVVTGSGGSFCAGIDLSDLAGRDPEDRGRSGNRADSLDRWMLLRFPKPVVAAIDGAAVGMGVEITCQADMRIGSPEAKLAWNFGARGLVPDMGVSSRLLPAIVGLPHALELLFSGRPLGAEEAHRLGYLSHIADDPVEKAVEIATAMAAHSPFALKETKRLVYEGMLDPAGHIRRHDRALQACFDSEDHHEGVAAFMEKREPKWRPAAFDVRREE